MNTNGTPTPTDFLSRMLEKALGTVDPVEPRLPSLFEPPQGDVAMPVPEAARNTLASPAPPDNTARPPAPPSVAEAGVHRVPANGALAAPDAHDRGDRDASPAPRSTPADTALADLVPKSMQGPPPARDAATPAGPASDPSRADAAARQSASPAHTNEPTRASVMLRAEGTPPRERPVAPDDAGLAAPPAPDSQGTLANRALVFPSSVAAASAPAMSARATPLTDPTEPGAAPLAPVINVTIGRVEVRATAGPPPRPGNHASSQKPLSLDDYLKQQRERR